MSKIFSSHKWLMLVACIAMMLCVSVGVSATEMDGTTTTITLNLQKVDRTVSPISTVEIDTFTFSALSTDTLKEALDKAVADTSNKLTAVEWTTVPIVAWDEESQTYVPTGEYAFALESLTYDGDDYENTTIESTSNYYKGEAWSYFYGTGATPPSTWDYPALYLSQVYVSGLAGYSNSFTLSFELSEYNF